jgi:hypothetical protein
MWRGLTLVALLAGALTGCGAATEDARGAAPSVSADAVAERATTIGAEGSACELPVTFDIAEGWKPQAVDSSALGAPADETVDALFRQGPVTAACEVDAKPAGNIGFLRVWTGEAGAADARSVLEAFVAAEEGVSKATYRTFERADLVGVEVEYLHTGESLEEPKKERALAVTTPAGPVVLHLGGMDTEEHEAMLPAYELAKRTLRTRTG